MDLMKSYSTKVEVYHSTWKPTNFIFYRGDSNVYPLTINLVSKDKPFPLDPDWNVRVTFRTEDSSSVPIVGHADIIDAINGVTCYNLIGSEISVLGQLYTDIQIITPTEILTCQGFTSIVKAPLNDAGAEPPEEYKTWMDDIEQQLVGKLSKVYHDESLTGEGTSSNPLIVDFSKLVSLDTDTPDPALTRFWFPPDLEI